MATSAAFVSLLQLVEFTSFFIKEVDEIFSSEEIR